MSKLKLPEPASQNKNEKTHVGFQGTGGNLENKQIKKKQYKPMGKQQTTKTSKNISYPWENFMHSKDEPKLKKKDGKKNLKITHALTVVRVCKRLSRHDDPRGFAIIFVFCEPAAAREYNFGSVRSSHFDFFNKNAFVASLAIMSNINLLYLLK